MELNKENDNRRTILMINVHEDDVLCFRKEIVYALVKNGFKVVLLYPLGDRSNEIESNDVIVENIKMDRHGKNPIKDLMLLFRYIKALRKYAPSVVLLYTIKPNIYGSIAARFKRIPYVNNITGIGSAIGSKEGLLQKIIYILYRYALKHSSHVFFQNKPNQELFLRKKLCDESITSVIPGSGVDLGRFKYEKMQNNDTIIFNYIGRVMESKGIIEYLKAAKSVSETNTTCEFNILGFIEEDEKEIGELVLEYDRKGYVRYRGNQRNIRPWIVRSNAIIHPSKYGEGISNVLLETAATGRALITTNIPGCRELVSNNNGYLFEPGNVDQMMECIRNYLNLTFTERERLGENSRKLVEEHFSREIVVDAYINIVNEIVC